MNRIQFLKDKSRKRELVSVTVDRFSQWKI